jgi:PAS domain-containing protein
MAEDITDEHEAAEALRVANERLGVAQEAGNVGVFEVDFVTGVDHWTPQLERIFGLEPGGFKGSAEAWAELVHPEDRERAAQIFRAAVESKATTCINDPAYCGRTAVHGPKLCRIIRAEDGRPLRGSASYRHH